jgi:hypothetical protein
MRWQTPPELRYKPAFFILCNILQFGAIIRQEAHTTRADETTTTRALTGFLKTDGQRFVGICQPKGGSKRHE